MYISQDIHRKNEKHRNVAGVWDQPTDSHTEKQTDKQTDKQTETETV
jgi:hypothetical protein